MGKVTRRNFVGMVGAGAATLAAPRWLPAAAASSRPNIVLIMADDLGIEGVSCYGSDKFKTPNLDALAKEGIRFEICYSTPLCGPTRCQLMTGRYPFRTGGLTNQTAGLPLPRDEFSIARLLKQAGYATCCTGKWRQMGDTPGDWGFDEWITDPSAGGWYWQKNCIKNGQTVELDKDAYYEDVVCDFAMDFVRRHREGPFLLYYPTHFVHGPILRTPDSKPDSKDFYTDNIVYMDKIVGKVVAEIDRLGLRDKTLILFTADNGTARESGTIGGRQIHGAKGSMWEGGSRVPLIASWKGTTPEGKVSQDLISQADFFPALAELAGAKLPEGVVIDGQSFAPQLRGQAGKPREWIFVQLGAQWYVRERNWKLNQAGELFDMKDAPFEEKPVPADTQDAEGADARKRLQAVLGKLNPAAGKTVPPGFEKKKALTPEEKKARKKQKAAAGKGKADKQERTERRRQKAMVK
ncbi:sulfatase-like hydrolase/transferase [Candidatus Sumerlaeota bacterium]|nr:sulfatase-like hydrolase/transferase [Candidatus Sumerlaeota bacterium]